MSPSSNRFYVQFPIQLPIQDHLKTFGRQWHSLSVQPQDPGSVPEPEYHFVQIRSRASSAKKIPSGNSSVYSNKYRIPGTSFSSVFISYNIRWITPFVDDKISHHLIGIPSTLLNRSNFTITIYGLKQSNLTGLTVSLWNFTEALLQFMKGCFFHSFLNFWHFKP